MASPVIVSVVGPSEPPSDLYNEAYDLGKSLGKIRNVITVCGGLYGIMEAVAKGVSSQGGTVVGILPGESKHAANPFVTIPLATGLGHFRNFLIAQVCDFMVAIGESPGTVTEVSMALRIEKPVLVYKWKNSLPGTRPVYNFGDLVRNVQKLIERFLERKD